MAHMIDETTGKAAMISGNGIVPWHRLGEVIDGQLTGVDAVKRVLNWKVEQALAYAEINGQRVDSGHKINYRSDTGGILGVVGAQYVPFQNHDLGALVDGIAQLGGEVLQSVDTAGALSEGRRVWISAKLPRVVKTSRKDVTELYMLFSNAHDGSATLRLTLTGTRTVCNNTLTLALTDESATNNLTFRHVGNMAARVDACKSFLGILPEKIDLYEMATRSLAKCKVKDSAAGDYFAALFPCNPDTSAKLLDSIAAREDESARLMRELLAGYEKQTENELKKNAGILERMVANYHGDELSRGTAWGLYNAVSEWTDHQREYRTAERYFDGVVSGHEHAIKMDAFDLAYAMTGAQTSAVAV